MGRQLSHSSIPSTYSVHACSYMAAARLTGGVICLPDTARCYCEPFIPSPPPVAGRAWMVGWWPGWRSRPGFWWRLQFSLCPCLAGDVSSHHPSVDGSFLGHSMGEKGKSGATRFGSSESCLYNVPWAGHARVMSREDSHEPDIMRASPQTEHVGTAMSNTAPLWVGAAAPGISAASPETPESSAIFAGTRFSAGVTVAALDRKASRR